MGLLVEVKLLGKYVVITADIPLPGELLLANKTGLDSAASWGIRITAQILS